LTDGTFDVRVYSIERRTRANGYTYKVVWKVGTKKHSKTCPTKALADARRSDLLTAVKRGEPFSTETGMPISYSSKAADTNWYDFAVEFVDKTWPQFSANQRRNVDKAMTSVTIALLRTPPKQFDPVKVRTALREWAFNSKRRANLEDPMPDDVRVILDWVQRNTLKNGDQTAGHILAVAECAGMSAPRLAERFAYCLRKPTRDEIPWDRLEAALVLPDLPSKPTPTARRP